MKTCECDVCRQEAEAAREDAMEALEVETGMLYYVSPLQKMVRDHFGDEIADGAEFNRFKPREWVMSDKIAPLKFYPAAEGSKWGSLIRGEYLIVASGVGVEEAKLIVLAVNHHQKLVDLLACFIDGEPCRLDHHGMCQEHYATTDDGKCAVAEARKLLAEIEGGAK